MARSLKLPFSSRTSALADLKFLYDRAIDGMTLLERRFNRGIPEKRYRDQLKRARRGCSRLIRAYYAGERA